MRPPESSCLLPLRRKIKMRKATLHLATLLALLAFPASRTQAQTLKVKMTGQETVLHRFTYSDGAGPSAGLSLDKAGNLYGTTAGGGAGNCVLLGVSGCGAVFKLDTTGNETVLYRFTNVPDGTLPYAGLIMDKAGNLYGTTEFGGDGSCDFGVGCGTVLRLETTGNESRLYSFMGPPAGAVRLAGRIMVMGCER